MVKHFTTNICTNLVSDQCSKRLIENVIKQCGFETSDVFDYLNTLLIEHLPEFRNKVIDKKGWVKIFTHFINHRQFSSFGTMLKERLPYLNTTEEYELCFYTLSTMCGYNPEHLLTEIYIDSLGWMRMVETLVKISKEKEVPDLHIEKKKCGRRRKRIERTKESEPTKVGSTIMVSSKPDKRDRETLSHKTKRPYRRPIGQYTLEGVLVKQFDSGMDAERETGINHSNIYSCLKNNCRTAGGYIWKCIEVESKTETEKKPISVEVRATIFCYKLTKDKELDLDQCVGSFKTQQEVSDTLGINKSTLSNYKNGRKKSIRYKIGDEKYWIGFQFLDAA